MAAGRRGGELRGGHGDGESNCKRSDSSDGSDHFAGLADEYYTSDVAYETGAAEHPEPWEPNITALHDPAHVKWSDFIEKETPLPTPWDKLAFEKHSAEYQAERRKLRNANVPESQMDTLFRTEQVWETQFLGTQKYAGKVGAFATPTLRGAALRPSFFHDGSAKTLEAAVDWHLSGGIGAGADKGIVDLQPVTLSAAERGQLLAFVRALTGPVTAKEPALP